MTRIMHHHLILYNFCCNIPNLVKVYFGLFWSLAGFLFLCFLLFSHFFSRFLVFSRIFISYVFDLVLFWFCPSFVLVYFNFALVFNLYVSFYFVVYFFMYVFYCSNFIIFYTFYFIPVIFLCNLACS